ncbi:MAG: dioxygenase [Chloroflexi bacterium]|nr:dioxygenase [Chloroflexota bacterium]
MYKKPLTGIVPVICALVLAACATSAPSIGTPSANNSDAGGTASIPTCAAGSKTAILTPELTEGPYFTANSPERASLFEEGMAGTKIVITGYVYTIDCKPVANALLDFWQANANGEYDNNGYTLRGHQFTDANGHYELTTIVPGIYPGRTEHIHFKVQAPNGKLMTSQLFFPGVSQNDSDGIFDQRLLLAIQETGDGLRGQYNFVVPAP